MRKHATGENEKAISVTNDMMGMIWRENVEVFFFLFFTVDMCDVADTARQHIKLVSASQAVIPQLLSFFCLRLYNLCIQKPGFVFSSAIAEMLSIFFV